MTRQQRKDYNELMRVLKEEFPNIEPLDIEYLTDELCTLAKKARRYDIHNCNYELSPRQEKAANKTDERAKEICAILGCELQFGDPRACAYRLLLPSKRSNSFGGEGWIVPEV